VQWIKVNVLAFLLLVDENGPIPYLKMDLYTPMGSREKGKCRKEGSPNQREPKLCLIKGRQE
jgi:hypothetical protein